MNLCSIASGSSGNCIYTGTQKCGILIDAGISAKKIEQGLAEIDRNIKEIKGILFSSIATNNWEIEREKGKFVFINESNCPRNNESCLIISNLPFHLLLDNFDKTIY